MTQPIDLTPKPQLSPEEAAIVNAASQLVPIYEKMAAEGVVDGEININAIILTASRIGIDTMINHAITQGYMEDPRVAAAAEEASKEGYLGDIERRDKEEAMAKEEAIAQAQADADADEAEYQAQIDEEEEAEAAAEADAKELMEMDNDEVSRLADTLCPPSDLAELPEPSEALSQPLDNTAKQA